MANRTFRVGEKYNSGLDKKLYTIFFLYPKNNVIILDGDEIRKGISKDLGFSITDRTENVRRIAEIARLLIEHGFTVFVACMSPKLAMRDLAKSIIGGESFLEVYCNASWETCKNRDVKGLYKKFYKDGITNFTQFYEESPHILWLPTNDRSIASCVEILIYGIKRKFL